MKLSLVFCLITTSVALSRQCCQKRLLLDPLPQSCRPRTSCALSFVDVVAMAGLYPKRGKMVFVRGGGFQMGSSKEPLSKVDGEHPQREVFVNDFFMDETEVTNAAFAVFVEDTGYVTLAEKSGTSAVNPLQISGEIIETGSYSKTSVPWFYTVPGANWRAPHGPGSTWKDVPDHPAVQMAWEDANEYCKWAGKRLPTEAEWEYACEGGEDWMKYSKAEPKKFPWGDELKPDGSHRMNTWQGDFPHENTAEDGYKWTAPVRTYPNNSLGLYEMTGNVWEWVADWWTTEHVPTHDILSLDPQGPDSNPHGLKTKKGGSYLCHPNHGFRARCAGRHMNPMATTSSTIGFRCVMDVAEDETFSDYEDDEGEDDEDQYDDQDYGGEDFMGQYGDQDYGEEDEDQYDDQDYGVEEDADQNSEVDDEAMAKMMEQLKWD